MPTQAGDGYPGGRPGGAGGGHDADAQHHRRRGPPPRRGDRGQARAGAQMDRPGAVPEMAPDPRYGHLAAVAGHRDQGAQLLGRGGHGRAGRGRRGTGKGEGRLRRRQPLDARRDAGVFAGGRHRPVCAGALLAECPGHRVGLPGGVHRRGGARALAVLQPRGRRHPGHFLPGLHSAHLPDEGHPPRLPVPRRRAQGGAPLGSQAAAHRRARPHPFHASSPLRHQLPPVCDGDQHPGVHGVQV